MGFWRRLFGGKGQEEDSVHKKEIDLKDEKKHTEKREIDVLRDLLKDYENRPSEFVNELKGIGFHGFEHTPFGTVTNGKEGRFIFFAGSSTGKISQAKYLDRNTGKEINLLQQIQEDSSLEKSTNETDSDGNMQTSDSGNNSALLKLFEFGFDPSFSGNKNISEWWDKHNRIEEYEKSLKEIVAKGNEIVPILIHNLDKSFYIAKALGQIGSTEALDALKRELHVPDAARVHASVSAIGETKNPEMIPVLQQAVKSNFVNSSAELFTIFSIAEGKLRAAKLGDKLFELERNAPVEQINTFMSQRREYCKDEKTRIAVLECLKECGETLPQLQFTFGDRSAVRSKAWAYWRVAMVFYYFTYPDHNNFKSPCKEAYQWAKEAIRLDPDLANYSADPRTMKIWSSEE